MRARARRVEVRGSLARIKARTNNGAVAGSAVPPQKNKPAPQTTARKRSRLILQYAYPEVGYKQAMGIVHLTRLYEKDRIENACRQALVLQHCSFRTIDNMLRSGTDQLELPLSDNNHIPAHDNIRGAEHYQ